MARLQPLLLNQAGGSGAENTAGEANAGSYPVYRRTSHLDGEISQSGR